MSTTSTSAAAGGPRHSVSTAAVTLNQRGQVLVIQRRDTGAWQIPGGVLELAEAIEHGVQREVLEETGVQIGVDQLTGVYKNLIRAVVSLVFRCHPIAGEPGPTDEARDARWMDIQEALALMTPVFAVRVRDALADRPAQVRTHDGTNLL